MKRKLLFILLIIACYCNPIFAQLFYNNGATVKVQNGAILFVDGDFSNSSGTLNSDGQIHLTGDWTCGSTYVRDDDSLIFSGSVQQDINHTTSTSIWSLIIDNATGGARLLNDIVVNTLLHLNNSELDLNSNKLGLKSNSTSIIQKSANGYILSETDYAAGYGEVEWAVHTSTGTYTIPFGSGAGTADIPVTIDVTSAGTPTIVSLIKASTYPTNPAPTPNNLSYPNTVTDMDDLGGSDNSLNTVDRFWMVDFINYSANPTITLSFNYTNTDLGGSNSITESSLMAYYWNSGVWSSSGLGTVTTSSNLYSGLSGITESRIWTLSNNNSFLPLEDISLQLSPVDNKYFVLSWQADIMDIDYFALERSEDMQNFSSIANIYSHQVKTPGQWEFNDFDVLPNKSYYYRIKFIRKDKSHGYSNLQQGKLRQHDMIHVGAFYPNPGIHISHIDISLPNADVMSLRVMNTLGQTVFNDEKTLPEGISTHSFDFSELASGLYHSVIKIGTEVFSRQIVITH